MKNLLLALQVLVFFSGAVYAQTFNMPQNGSDTTTVCNGTLYDSGGPSGSYSNGSNGYFYLDVPGGTLDLTFTSFSLESCCDRVSIYDGLGTSGTRLYYVGGYGLPNGGQTISVPSGKATIRFTSDGSVTSSGFAMTWSGGGTAAPTAGFSISNNNPGLGMPVAFTNNSINTGSYNWDFGDGNTSADPNPSHVFTAAGTYNVQLVVSNCYSTDSITQSVTVQNAPQFSVSPDSLYISTFCGTGYSDNITIADTAGGPLAYSLQGEDLNFNPIIFHESFENGLGQFTRDPNANTGFTSNVVLGNAGHGNASLALSGYTYYQYALNHSMPLVQPEKISYRINPTSSYNSGFVEFIDDQTYGYSIYMVNTYMRYGSMYFNTGTYVPPVTLASGSWHLIEFENIDWTAKTFDITINNTSIATGVSFSNNNAQGISYMNLYTNNATTYYFDDIRLEMAPASPISMSPTNGTLNSGSSQVVNITGSTNGMLAGIYNYQIKINTNAQEADSVIYVPLTLDVQGSSPLQFNKSCFAMDTVYTGRTYQDSLQIVNTGCDSLPLTSITASNSELSSSVSSFVLAPFDTTYLQVSFNTLRTGSLTDTLYLSNSDSTYAICLNATGISAPAISTDSLTYNVYHVGCPDSVNFDMWVYNTGQDTLNWGTGQSFGSLTDDFESISFNTSIWASWGNSIGTSSNCGTISGSRSLLFNYGGARFIETVPLNTMAGGTIDFDLDQSNCDNAEFGEGITLSYSLNNGVSWVSFATNIYVNQSSTLAVSQAIPVAAQGNGVKFRISQPSFSGGTFDTWIIDNFSITTGVANGLSFTPDTASVVPADSVLVTATIPTAGLTTGVHNFPAVFTSNDPNNNYYMFGVNLHLTGSPTISGPLTCVSMDSIIVGTSAADSMLLTNDGCGDLILNNLSTGSTEFTVGASNDTLSPGDSIYVSVGFAPTGLPGMRNDTITVLSNDSALSICISGFALGAPAAMMDTSAIIDTIYSCNDSINIQRYLSNANGLSNLNFRVAGNDLSDLQDVLDTFKISSSSVYSQIPNPYNFYDGIYNYYISDGGGDMYDGGNYISTNFLSNIYYSNDAVIPSTAFGTNGAYFTYKATGLWLLAADLDGVTNFNISGYLGADGWGNVDAAVLSTSVNGKSYTGFVKRVYSAGDPSVNHLVIIEDNPSASHTYSANTNYDDHSISGLNGTERIYYLLYAGSGGSYIDNSATLNIMNSFLAIAEGSALPSWVSVQPDSGMVNSSDSTMLDIWLNSTGLSNGNHSGLISVNTNDPNQPVLRIPVTLTVLGTPQIERVNGLACLDFDTIQQGAVVTDTVWVRNYGCDTLSITSASGSNAAFSLQNTLPVNVAPADTVPLLISFSPTNIGLETDTLLINNNDSVLAICLTGESVGAPVLSLGRDTISVDVNKCKIIANENFMVNNTGQGPMNYDISFGGYTASSHIPYNLAGTNTVHTFNNVPQSDTLELRLVFNGDYDAYNERFTLYIDNSYYYGYVNNNNRFYQGDTVTLLFSGAIVQGWTSDGTISFDLNNYYLVDGGAGSFHQVDIRLASQVNWVAVVGSASGNLAANSSINKNLIFNSSSLALGTYYTNMNISNNSVGNPNASVVVEMNVVSTPEIILSDTCVQFPLTLLGDTATKQLTIYNDGCQPLNIASLISTNNAAFKVSPSNGSVAMGDSLQVTVDFIPSSVTNYSASLLVNNNDSNQVVCLSGFAGAIPDADFQFSITNNCMGSVSFTDHTTQATPSSYFWDFGDGNNSQLPNPSHQYTLPGTYSVLLRASNNFGFDTIRQDVTVNPLVADFSMSADTIDIGDTLYLTDQSIVANSWIWSFGDGGSSTVQNAQHVYQAQGKYNVRLTVTDTNSCVRFIEKDIVVINSIGMKELSIENDLFSLYPNPNNGRFYLESKQQNWSAYELRIMDMRGAIISQFSDLDNSREIELELSNLNAGVYQILILEDGNYRSRKSFVIQ